MEPPCLLCDSIETGQKLSYISKKKSGLINTIFGVLYSCLGSGLSFFRDELQITLKDSYFFPEMSVGLLFQNPSENPVK